MALVIGQHKGVARTGEILGQPLENGAGRPGQAALPVDVGVVGNFELIGSHPRADRPEPRNDDLLSHREGHAFDDKEFLVQ